LFSPHTNYATNLIYLILILILTAMKEMYNVEKKCKYLNFNCNVEKQNVQNLKCNKCIRNFLIRYFMCTSGHRKKIEIKIKLN